jgi:hypothetical protein
LNEKLLIHIVLPLLKPLMFLKNVTFLMLYLLLIFHGVVYRALKMKDSLKFLNANFAYKASQKMHACIAKPKSQTKPGPSDVMPTQPEKSVS